MWISPPRSDKFCNCNPSLTVVPYASTTLGEAHIVGEINGQRSTLSFHRTALSPASSPAPGPTLEMAGASGTLGASRRCDDTDREGLTPQERALAILRQFEQACKDMRGRAVVLSDGKAGNVENLRLDELHGLRVSIVGLLPRRPALVLSEVAIEQHARPVRLAEVRFPRAQTWKVPLQRFARNALAASLLCALS